MLTYLLIWRFMTMSNDKKIIEKLGGAARVAVLLGYDKRRGGVQRVHNWMSRGIPAKVKLEHQDIFNVVKR